LKAIPWLPVESKTPIIAPEKIKQALNFLINLTQIIVSTGVDKKKLLDYNKNLEQKIQDRTAALNTEIKIRKKAEVQLRSNQKFLESVFDAIQDGISVLDSDLNIVQANQIMYKLYPHLTESLGKKCYRVYHGRSERCDVCPSIRSIESRKPEMNEIPLTLNNKRVGTLELFSFPIMDESGGVKGLVEYVRDITKRKHIENQIRMEKEFSESLINCLPGIMYVFDRSGRIKRWNKNFETVTGYGENQIAEMTPMGFIAPRDKINVKKTIDRINQEGLFTIEAGLSTIDGRVIPYLFTGYKYVTQEIEYIIGVGLDITERKKTEAEKEGLIEKLQESLSEVRQLSGLLPICASCKKIRDDKGYWNQLESYIEHHTNAAFSHGMCPECSDKFYGHENWYKRMKRKKGQ
jgi:PAS domain S-box-containing protein